MEKILPLWLQCVHWITDGIITANIVTRSSLRIPEPHFYFLFTIIQVIFSSSYTSEKKNLKRTLLLWFKDQKIAQLYSFVISAVENFNSNEKFSEGEKNPQKMRFISMEEFANKSINIFSLWIFFLFTKNLKEVQSLAIYFRCFNFWKSFIWLTLTPQIVFFCFVFI